MRRSSPPLGRVPMLAIGLGLAATACAGGVSAPDTPEAAAASVAAEANIDQLQTSSDVRDIQVLDVADGSITSLRESTTGDRPVLLWFWAPH